MFALIRCIVAAITLLDYGAGNVRSVRNAIRYLGFSVKDVIFICTPPFFTNLYDDSIENFFYEVEGVVVRHGKKLDRCTKMILFLMILLGIFFSIRAVMRWKG